MDLRIISLFITAIFLFSVEGKNPSPTIATFSIVARDPLTQELGVAVQSKFIAVR